MKLYSRNHYVQQKNYSRVPFSLQERFLLQSYLSEGRSQRWIANILKRSPSVINREIMKFPNIDKYSATDSQRIANSRLELHGRKTKCKRYSNFICELEKCSSKYMSPETFRNVFAKNNKEFPCVKTIYNWVKQNRINIIRIRKQARNKAHYHTTTRNIIGRSILERPPEISNRNTFGHWELDLMQLKSNGYLVVIVERLSRLCSVSWVKQKTSEAINRELKQMITEIGAENFKTITTDNGSEFYDLHEIENRFKTIIYYARTYRSCDKGSVENAIGLIRRTFPKWMCTSEIDELEFREVEQIINKMPRKILNYENSYSAFLKHATI